MINAAGINLIKKYEGLVDGDPDTPGLDPYRCVAGIPTLGYGACTGLDGNPVSMDHPPISPDQAEQLLERDIQRFEISVARLVGVPVTRNMLASLISICFNIGPANFQVAVFRMRLNRGDYRGCADNFWQWRRAGASGKIWPGLVRRREEERQLFLTPDAPEPFSLFKWLAPPVAPYPQDV